MMNAHGMGGGLIGDDGVVDGLELTGGEGVADRPALTEDEAVPCGFPQMTCISYRRRWMRRLVQAAD